MSISPPQDTWWSVLGKWIALAIDAGEVWTRPVRIASLSVAGMFLEMVQSRVLPDIERVKEALIRRTEAETEEKEADVQIKLAKATIAANKAILLRSQELRVQADARQKLATAQKTHAEAEAIRIEAQTRLIAAQADAREHFLEQLCAFRANGGELFVDEAAIKALLRGSSETELQGKAKGPIASGDDEVQRERLSRALSIPISDFEFSVRTRNGLQKMGIKTLGDLARVTESELLESKHFGETSLTEIREMLSSRGIEMGMFANERTDAELDFSSMSPEMQALLMRPIADLNLSVRARKCMVRLQLNTIGELVSTTADVLLKSKNFGVTTLNEVREKLGQFGLRLRGD